MLLIIALNSCFQKSKLLGYWNDGSLEELRYTEDSVFHYIDGESVQGAPYKIMGNIVQHKFLICELLGTGICSAHMIVNDKLLIRDQEGNLEVVYKKGKIKNYQGNLLATKNVEIQLPKVKGELFKNDVDSVGNPIYDVLPIYGGPSNHHRHKDDENLFHVQLNDVLAETEDIYKYLEYDGVQNKKRVIPLFIDENVKAKSFIPVFNELRKAQSYATFLVTENSAVQDYDPYYGVPYTLWPISDFEIELYNKVYSDNPFTISPNQREIEENSAFLKNGKYALLQMTEDGGLLFDGNSLQFEFRYIFAHKPHLPKLLILNDNCSYKEYVKYISQLQKWGFYPSMILLQKEYDYLTSNQIIPELAL